MTTPNFLDAIKNVASQTNDDSILGANVRRILQEVRAIEAMKEYDSNQLSINDDWLVSQYNRNRDINDQINNVDEIEKN